MRATAGQVLLYAGAPADTLFTSTCGGRTEDAVNVFPSYSQAAFPYLRSVSCTRRGEAPARDDGATRRHTRKPSGRSPSGAGRCFTRRDAAARRGPT